MTLAVDLKHGSDERRGRTTRTRLEARAERGSDVRYATSVRTQPLASTSAPISYCNRWVIAGGATSATA